MRPSTIKEILNPESPSCGCMRRISRKSNVTVWFCNAQFHNRQTIHIGPSPILHRSLVKMTSCWKFLSFLLILFFFLSSSSSNIFTITNNCPYTIWPGTLSGSGSPPLTTTGFQLNSGQSAKLTSVPGWSGRIWGRTGCKFDATGIGKCQTGDCGGRLECDGNGAAPPTSLFEITLGQGNTLDYYDVSMVDGYNLPILAVPRDAYGGGACNATGCVSDLNRGCPKELQVVGGEGGYEGGVVGCKSACVAFGSDWYCCSGEFANPNTCQPTYYSTIFKRACPRAYSYAFDDGTSTFTCKANEYDIVFCPNANRIKRPNNFVSPPPPYQIDQPTGKTVKEAASTSSSSTIVSPFSGPVLIFILMISLTFSALIFSH